METTTEQLVTEAVGGNRESLEEIIRRIQGKIYGLALRMVFHPADAEDSTQEILIKVITHLESFRFEDPFNAWAMKIAANHLKSVRKGHMEKREFTMEKVQGIVDHAAALGWLSELPEAPDPVMEVEVRSACTQAMLLALGRGHRMAFILGVIMDVTSSEGAFILGISSAAYRKRLSRARRKVTDFLNRSCGIFDDANPCHCNAVLKGHVERGWVNPQKPLFVGENREGLEGNEVLGAYMMELDELGRLATFYKASVLGEETADFSGMVKELVEEGEYRVFSELH
ncbi:MAG: RNA polymerase sigma factor [Deltaproteobacteria bacterium]|nr:RNA polymerase sigma factor [Deltaproteobacteria bacterium]